MKNKNETKLFAFKVAEQKSTVKSEAKWKLRDGVANAAGCTGPDGRTRNKNGYGDAMCWC